MSASPDCPYQSDFEKIARDAAVEGDIGRLQDEIWAQLAAVRAPMRETWEGTITRLRDHTPYDFQFLRRYGGAYDFVQDASVHGTWRFTAQQYAGEQTLLGSRLCVTAIADVPSDQYPEMDALRAALDPDEPRPISRAAPAVLLGTLALGERRMWSRKRKWSYDQTALRANLQTWLLDHAKELRVRATVDPYGYDQEPRTLYDFAFPQDYYNERPYYLRLAERPKLREDIERCMHGEPVDTERNWQSLEKRLRSDLEYEQKSMANKAGWYYAVTEDLRKVNALIDNGAPELKA